MSSHVSIRTRTRVLSRVALSPANGHTIQTSVFPDVEYSIPSWSHLMLLNCGGGWFESFSFPTFSETHTCSWAQAHTVQRTWVSILRFHHFEGGWGKLCFTAVCWLVCELWGFCFITHLIGWRLQMCNNTASFYTSKDLNLGSHAYKASMFV